MHSLEQHRFLKVQITLKHPEWSDDQINKECQKIVNGFYDDDNEDCLYWQLNEINETSMKFRATKRKMNLTNRIGIDFKFVQPVTKSWWEVYLSIYLYSVSFRITLEKH